MIIVILMSLVWILLLFIKIKIGRIFWEISRKMPFRGLVRFLRVGPQTCWSMLQILYRIGLTE